MKLMNHWGEQSDLKQTPSLESWLINALLMIGPNDQLFVDVSLSPRGTPRKARKTSAMW